MVPGGESWLPPEVRLQPDGEGRFHAAAKRPADRYASAAAEHGDEVPEGSANELVDGGDADDRGAVRPHELRGQDLLEVFQRSTHAVLFHPDVKPDVVAGAIDPLDTGFVDDDDAAPEAEDKDRPLVPALVGQGRGVRRREAFVLDA